MVSCDRAAAACSGLRVVRHPDVVIAEQGAAISELRADLVALASEVADASLPGDVPFVMKEEHAPTAWARTVESPRSRLLAPIGIGAGGASIPVSDQLRLSPG
jgi:hypothetical protein